MRVRAGVAISLALSVALSMALAGCGDGKSTATGPTSAAPATTSAGPVKICNSDKFAGAGVTFPNASGAMLGGFTLGTGAAGVVLAPQAGEDSCSFAPYALRLVARGYRVLALDFHGEGRSTAGTGGMNSGDVVAAADQLRKAGATKIVLIGTSRGGTAALIAATLVSPPVAGVVNVSGPVGYQGESATTAVAKLAVPVLYAVGKRDTEFDTDAKTLLAATPGSAKRLVEVDSGDHGVAFLGGDPAGADQPTKDLNAAIDDFLKATAPVA